MISVEQELVGSSEAGGCGCFSSFLFFVLCGELLYKKYILRQLLLVLGFCPSSLVVDRSVLMGSSTTSKALEY